MSADASPAFQPLRGAFAVNAVFSTVAGLVMLAGANPLAAASIDLPQVSSACRHRWFLRPLEPARRLSGCSWLSRRARQSRACSMPS